MTIMISQASNDLKPIAQRTTQMTPPVITASSRPMPARRLADQGGGKLRHDGSRLGGGIAALTRRLGDGAHEPRADDDAVRPGRCGGGRLLTGGDAEAQRDRHGAV